MLRTFTKLVVAATFVVVGAMAYTQAMLRIGSGTPPDMRPIHEQADLIVVDKSDYRLTLYKNSQPLRTYPIALGGNPKGHKQFEGDERTPEGHYEIDWRNSNSIAHLSLHISYPNRNDQRAAAAVSKDPGGNIMIHGVLNGWGWFGWVLQSWNWTNGCIAVTNAHMRDIWSRVPNGTAIEIKA